MRCTMRLLWLAFGWEWCLRGFYRDGEPVRCPVCNCRRFKETNVVLIDNYYGPVCEADVQCEGCSTILGFWAYGHYHHDNWKTICAQPEIKRPLGILAKPNQPQPNQTSTDLVREE